MTTVAPLPGLLRTTWANSTVRPSSVWTVHRLAFSSCEGVGSSFLPGGGGRVCMYNEDEGDCVPALHIMHSQRGRVTGRTRTDRGIAKREGWAGRGDTLRRKRKRQQRNDQEYCLYHSGRTHTATHELPLSPFRRRVSASSLLPSHSRPSSSVSRPCAPPAPSSARSPRTRPLSPGSSLSAG